jgi:hypothetical protein
VPFARLRVRPPRRLRRRRGGVLGLLLVLAGLGAARGLRGRRLGLLRLAHGALGLGLLQLGRDELVVLRAQVDLVVEVGRGAVALDRGVRRELVLALERVDLLDGHLELVGDPGIRPALLDPGADLVEMWAQRTSSHVALTLTQRVLTRPARQGAKEFFARATWRMRE